MATSYRIYHWFDRKNNCMGVGLEEFQTSNLIKSVVAFASIYVDQMMTDADLYSMVIDEHCTLHEKTKIVMSRRIPRSNLDELKKKYPNIRFRLAATEEELRDIKVLCFDAIDRKSTVSEKF
jgi:hypothetical protein